MRLLKPSWVNHNGKPIFSCAIHPDGSRFATGGHSEDSCSGKVVIWNMAPVREEKIENDPDVPKILCQMDNHLACVNCVRWSHSGKCLVSGGDDKLIMVWQSVKGSCSSTVFGTGGKVVNVEHWKCVSTLRGHSGDVLDLAWSPHDLWLASCSVDNTIVVWNTLKFPEQLSVLRGHSGLVKGITWDPVGKYIASQSDDKSLRVWRTHDWQQETVINKPFQECGGTTHVLRLDWSPDGSTIVSAHAMNNSGPTAQSIERKDWKISVDFVGHRKAITVVRFNERIFSRKVEGEKRNEYTCCAIGSRDRSLSIWLMYLKRPLVVIHDLFDDSIMDISWSNKLSELLCCSWDGSVAFMDFDADEIGKPHSQSDMCAYYEKEYGQSLSLNNNATSANVIVESADMLTLQENVPEWNVEKPKVNTEFRTPLKSKPQKQIETITPDGRRRITPIMLSASPEVTDVPAPFNSGSENSIEFKTSTEQSKIIIEKVDCPSSGSKLGTSPLRSLSSPVKGLNDAELSIPVLSPVEDKVSQDKEPEKKDDGPTRASNLKVKRKLDTTAAAGAPKRAKKDKETKQMPTLSQATPVTTVAEPEHIPTPQLQVTITTPTVLPGVLSLKSFTKQFTIGAKIVTLEVDNCVQTGAITLHKLRCLRNGVLHWEQLFSARILLVTASNSLVAVACDDHTLTIMSDHSKRLFPPILQPSKPTLLESCSCFVLSVCQSAHVSVWNVRTKSCLIKSESLSPLLKNNGVKLKRASITSNGVVVIEISDGKSYTYNTQISAWCLVNDGNDVLRQCIDHVTYPSTPLAGTLANITKASHVRLKSHVRSLHSSQPAIQKVATLSHLEAQMVSCLALHSPTEYQFWLLTYVRYLVQQNEELKLREVFDDLLGSTSFNCDQSPHIMGLDKRELLQELLPLLGSNLQLQRLYTEYRDQLSS